MSINSSDNMSRVHELEMKFQQGIHQADLVNRDEDARRYKLRALSLRDENANLKDKITHQAGQLSLLKKQVIRLQSQLEDASGASSTLDARIKKQADENGRLKVELEALRTAEQDSSKALKEKFALKRELDQLKPEVDHLKAQVAGHRAVVAEKQSLQRQLESLEVELENERRSKAKARAEAADEAMVELQAQLDEALQQLAKEKREREKMQKEHNKELAEANTRTERFEERMSTQKQKLKDSQAELKKTQAELESCRAELQRAQVASRNSAAVPAKSVAAKVLPGRKRHVQEMSFEDITIQTPGNDSFAPKRQAKKRGFEKALVGEKSTFSVTPFLSRTKDVSDDSLDIASPTTSAQVTSEIIEEVEEEEEEEQQPEVVQKSSKPSMQALPTLAEEPASQTSQASKPRGRPRTKALAESASSKKNMPTAKAALSARKTLEKVVEEPTLGEQENKAATKLGEKPELKLKALGVTANAPGLGASDADAKKRKRKLLGANKTLFDEEDEEIAPKVQKTQLAPGRKLKAPLGGLNNAFAGKTFSPLKRDRRGIHASFLA